MENCRLLLLTGAVLAVLAMPALAADLAVDVYSEWNLVQPGFDDLLYCGYSGTMDPTVTNAAGITVTLDGMWGGRNRAATMDPDNPPDYTERNLLAEHGGPWTNDDIQTVTISGLEPGMIYNTSLWAWEQGQLQGFDLSANGVKVVDDYVSVSHPTSNDDNRIDFQATADESGEVVLEYSDPRSGAGPGAFPSFKINALEMTVVPEPGSLVLLLSLAGLGLVSFLRRK